MGSEDYAFRWGVEDASFGKPCTHPASPITPDVRERYLMGYNSDLARTAANRAMVEREQERRRKAQAQWTAKLSGEPIKRKRGKHEHGKDW